MGRRHDGPGNSDASTSSRVAQSSRRPTRNERHTLGAAITNQSGAGTCAGSSGCRSIATDGIGGFLITLRSLKYGNFYCLVQTQGLASESESQSDWSAVRYSASENRTSSSLITSTAARIESSGTCPRPVVNRSTSIRSVSSERRPGSLRRNRKLPSPVTVGVITRLPSEISHEPSSGSFRYSSSDCSSSNRKWPSPISRVNARSLPSVGVSMQCQVPTAWWAIATSADLSSRLHEVQQNSSASGRIRRCRSFINGTLGTLALRHRDWWTGSTTGVGSTWPSLTDGGTTACASC